MEPELECAECRTRLPVDFDAGGRQQCPTCGSTRRVVRGAVGLAVEYNQAMPITAVQGGVTVSPASVLGGAQVFAPTIVGGVDSALITEIQAEVERCVPAHHALQWNLYLRDPNDAEPLLAVEVIEQVSGQFLFGPASFATGRDVSDAMHAFVEELLGDE